MKKEFTKEDLAAYDQDGYVIKRAYFSDEEIGLIQESYQQDKALKNAAFEFGDSKGLATKLTLWYGTDDSIYSAFMQSERVLNGVQMILDGEVAMYHSKFMQKDPKVGGAWEWHQDYGYWYKNGFLFPYMMSVMVAVSEANKENGCLQVIPGTHKLGRIEHGFSGDQVGADIERVNICMEQMGLVYVELEPGDVLFFHGNLLHRSDSNRSERPRLSLISAYNLTSNKPFKEEPDSAHAVVHALPDERIVEIGARGIYEKSNFLTPDRDAALQK